jgi:hypothetical protein
VLTSYRLKSSELRNDVSAQFLNDLRSRALSILRFFKTRVASVTEFCADMIRVLSLSCSRSNQ